MVEKVQNYIFLVSFDISLFLHDKVHDLCIPCLFDIWLKLLMLQGRRKLIDGLNVVNNYKHTGNEPFREAL